MFLKWLRASAVMLGAIGFASIAQAAPVELVGKDANGNTVDSGWSWDTPDPSVVNLVFVRTDGTNFFFQKDATLTRADQPLIITFTKSTATPKTLVINDERITNSTGTDWAAFRMDLSSGSVGGTPNFAIVSNGGAAGTIGDFNIDPFTKFTFYNSNSGLLLNGGVVPAGTNWTPGSKGTQGLALVANFATASTFSLKEIPVAGVVIPLPAAAWTGLSMLVGLGVIRMAKRARFA